MYDNLRIGRRIFFTLSKAKKYTIKAVSNFHEGSGKKNLRVKLWDRIPTLKSNASKAKHFTLSYNLIIPSFYLRQVIIHTIHVEFYFAHLAIFFYKGKLRIYFFDYKFRL
jgi:hypothetical protein